METVVIKNEFLKVEISTLGAEIKSIQTPSQEELMWCADPDVWAGTAPVLFPICGRLKDNKYTYNGKTYELEGHGFTRKSIFEIKTADETKAVFSLKSNEETKKCYPFDFEFEVGYKLDKNSVTVEYKTINLSDSEPLYFSCGSHEAYACPEGIEEYSVVFEKPVTLNPHPPCGKLVEKYTTSLAENISELHLKEEYFKIDALVFEHLGINKVTLVHNKSSKRITVEFPEHDYLLFWNKYKAPYICIEPWAGFPDTPESDGIFEKKKGINKVEPSQSKSFIHKITFEN